MENNRVLPLIPLRGLTIFPNMVIHFDVGREKSKEAIEVAMKADGDIFLAPQKDLEIDEPKKSDVNKIGTIANIKQIVKLPNDVFRVLIEGKEKGKILKFKNKKSYLEVEVERIKEEVIDDVEIDAYLRSLKKSFISYMKVIGDTNPEMIKGVEMDNDPWRLSDIISGIVATKEADRLSLLEITDLKKKIKKLLFIIDEEISIIKLQKKIGKTVKDKADKSQKEYFLREQIKAIQEELGEDDEESEISKLEEQIQNRNLPKEVKEKALYEVKRLKSMSSNSSESNVAKTYIEWILDIPWEISTEENIDINFAEEIINRDHFGLKDVKDRIIEFLAVKQISGDMKGPILCLVGPPGVGKTSIVKSIAESMNRKYSRIALGGMRDESEIRGHRKTYVGAMPGRIAYALKGAKSMNPVILLDEIDKISSSYKGEPSDALLEVLDSEQNNTFRDNYLEVPMDLSKVLFIATANSLDTIPRPLLDRMEIIEVSGYTYEEKFNIAKKYLVNKQLKEHNVTNKIVKISDDAIRLVIEGYTRESGVRGLNRALGSLIRKALTEMLKKGNKSITVNSKKAEELLGKRFYSLETMDKEDKVGVVTGMAWTAYGGDTLPVEAMVMEGTGKLQLTGKLGDVMQESAKAAFTYVRANAKKYGIDVEFYKKKDVHIHVPEGAVPKDGPSAGVTMVTALVSALSEKKVKHNIAMTGEVTLTGRVLPIGGLKEKALAASRFGIDTIIIPKENEKDIDKIPDSVKDSLNIITASHVDTVLENSIIGVNK
ncbi:endopeptidase La [Clostridium thermobutyricum]|uniref:Lon protease n=1 Tax=Clostridium thermobutyricum DSM 4928 TaxID=1121339 RepID=A0A1V4SRK7_9CLOT|nr:Lon protease 1 [Clostridium thermobutyricum DSM 4928]OPX46153.1 Lon protease 1 [Clostridium thermobutyricum DSM 4928]